MTAKKRNIYPFGDKNHTRKAADYLIDCAAYTDQTQLQQRIQDQWHTTGLAVLANTGMQHLSELEHWGKMIFADFTAYEGGSAPRSKWSSTVFGIDDTPENIDMCYHNEACYLPTIPRCFVIGSLQALQQGGETLVSDNEVTTAAILDTTIGQALQKKGIRYIRNMTDKYAKDVFAYKHWQDTFYTDSRAEVEAYIQTQGWDYTWLPEGTLRTSYCVDAYEYNEQLNKNLYFAGLVSHAAFFDQWPPFNTLVDEDRAFTMTLGDGTPFTQAEISQLYAAYNQASLSLSWQQVDVALIDNERWSHARPAYQMQPGDQRVMGVTMGMMKQRLGSRF